MIVPIVAAVVLIGAVSLRAWAAISLMTHYSVDDYLATPTARRLYWTSAAAPVVSVLAIFVLATCTKIWWVEVAAGVFGIIVFIKTIYVVRLRVTGRYKAFYRASQWQ
jgi:hypothetical protein